jgi:hypothetical protein
MDASSHRAATDNANVSTNNMFLRDNNFYRMIGASADSGACKLVAHLNSAMRTKSGLTSWS